MFTITKLNDTLYRVSYKVKIKGTTSPHTLYTKLFHTEQECTEHISKYNALIATL